MVYEKVITELDDLRRSLNQETQKTNDTMVGILKDLNDGWWIPAEERVPKNDETVIVSLENNEVVMGVNHYGTWCVKEGKDYKPLKGVTAWMSKPTAYKAPDENSGKNHHHKK